MNETDENITITVAHPNQLLISGTISQANVIELVQQITDKSLPVGADLDLDFRQAWISDGLSMLVIINTLRSLATRVTTIRLKNSPEPLLESLQQSGILAEGLGIQLEEAETPETAP